MLPTREHPWNDRLVSAKHHQWLARLGSLHRLTRSWAEELRALKAIDRAEHLLTRGLDAEVSQGLWMLERLTSQGSQKIEPLLDDTTPDDVLGRLERTAWSVQVWMILSLRTPNGERGPLDAVLEQVAWRQGRQTAEESWAGARGKTVNASSAEPVALRPLLLALSASMLSGGTGPEGATSECFLVRRALKQEVFLELRTCPHQQPYCAAVAPKETIDRLCEFHSHWMRGFAYVLNSRAGLEHNLARNAGERCFQRWYLVD